MWHWIISPTASLLPNTLTGSLHWLKPVNLPSTFRPLSFSNLYYILRKLKGHAEALALLGKLKLLVRVSTVSESEIQSALSSSFGDFEDAIQHFTARTEGGISAIITRNKADYFDSDIPVLSPEEFLSKRAPTIQ